ncbi:helix-turn-helix domain-containing protein [Acetobacter indonesiensis]|nr:helix-turn-helix domain-containing protein [Acetobacter indonesiensis]
MTSDIWQSHQARCLRAMEHLSEGASVTDVAFDVGYDNVSAFIAMFRRVTGMTPGQFSQNR